jgi:hypothetical protein
VNIREFWKQDSIRIRISVSEFEFAEFSRHFQNANSPNIREFEFEMGKISLPMIPANKLSPKFHGLYKVLKEGNDTVKFRNEQGIKHNISKDRLHISPANDDFNNK